MTEKQPKVQIIGAAVLLASFGILNLTNIWYFGSIGSKAARIELVSVQDKVHHTLPIVTCLVCLAGLLFYVLRWFNDGE